MELNNVSVAKTIRIANRAKICTLGVGTFGCACPKCMKTMGRAMELVFDMGLDPEEARIRLRIEGFEII